MNNILVKINECINYYIFILFIYLPTPRYKNNGLCLLEKSKLNFFFLIHESFKWKAAASTQIQTRRQILITYNLEKGKFTWSLINHIAECEQNVK